METIPPPPDRSFVQTPRIVAARLGVFGVLLLLALRALSAGRRWLRLLAAGFLALSAAALGFALYVMSRTTRRPSPQPERDQGTGTKSEGAFAAAADIGRDIRLFPLQTGSTLASFGQFFGGHEGWVGLRAIWNMGADESMVFWAPVHGPLLVDTGIGRAQTEKGYYSARKGGVPGLIWKESDNYLPAEQELLPQLRRLGVEPEEIRHVIMTHLHEDHVGELNRFAHATVHLSRAEWEDRSRMGYAPSYTAIRQWNIFEFDSGRFHAFAASKDLFGDGTVILVPTYGHSFGHASLFLQMGEYALCLAADALYTLRHLDGDGLGAFNYFGREGFSTQTDSAHRLAAMQRFLPDLVYLPTHDPFAYTFELIHPFLADGRLTSAERKDLHAYQDALFDEAGGLRPAARPRFERINHGYGRVVAAIR